MKKCLTTLIFLVVAMSSIHVSANQWVTGKVTALEDYGSYKNGMYQVLISLKDKEWGAGGSRNGSSICTARFRLVTGEQGVTEAIKNRIFSLLLAAQMTNRKVSLFVDVDNGDHCAVQIGKISS